MYFQDTPGTLDSNRRVVLRQAIQDDTLIPIRSLTGSFPTAQVTLSYSESWSVMDFIIRHYGKAKLAQLLQEFKKGDTYDNILQRVLNVDTDGLETVWRQDIGAKPRVIPTRSNATPTPFPTFSIASDATPVPRGATSAPSAATPAPRAATSAPSAATPAPTSAPSAPSNPISQLCGGAFSLIAVGILGPVLYQRTRRSIR